MNAQPTSALPVDPRISVVIPVKNEAAGIAACLEGILNQRRAVDEILVIDSGSTDGTQDIVQRFDKTRLIEIAPSDFNHGDTRNLGVRESTGEIIVFTVGDARPVDDGWLDGLLAGFVADDIAAVSGAQVVPHETWTNPVEWFRPQSIPQIDVMRFDSREAFEAAEPEIRRRSCALDDVTAAYRRAALEAIPFRRIVYGEDVLFALDAYRAGWALAVNPAARVYHFHLEDHSAAYKRTLRSAALRAHLFSHPSAPPALLHGVLQAAYRLVREPALSWMERARWLAYNVEKLLAMRSACFKANQALAKDQTAVEVLLTSLGTIPPTPLRRTQ